MKVILTILFTVLLTLCYFYLSLLEEDDDYPVDIVYLWVAEEDPEREVYKKLEGIIQNDGNSTENRFNNNEELKYSLRSVEMYCPWVNNIYVFVKDGQCPEYLNLDNSKIRLVFHSQVIPQEYLPLFNTNPIEQHIHKIPGLADRYIYFNDDMMVNMHMNKSDFFQNGVPVINFRKSRLKDYGNVPDLPYNHPLLLWYNFLMCKKLFGVNYHPAQYHAPSACYKPWEEELERIIKENGFWYIRKFRTNRDVCLNNFVRALFYETKGSPKVHWGENYVWFKPENGCASLSSSTNPFICINEISHLCKEQYLEFVNSYFPKKSQFEK